MSQLPEPYAQFLTTKAPEHILKIFQTTDPREAEEGLRNTVGKLIPKNWPEIRLDYSEGTETLFGVDMATALLCLAVTSSPMQNGVEYLPDSFYKVRDGIWNPQEGILLQWNHTSHSFSCLTGERYVEGEKLYRSLQGVKPGLTPFEAEPNMANLLTAFSTTIELDMDDDEGIETLLSVGVRAGYQPEDMMPMLVAARRTAFNHLLSRSPMFTVAKVAVACDRLIAGEVATTPEIYFTKVLIGIEEFLEDAAVLRDAAISDGEAIKMPMKGTPVVFTERDPAFQMFAMSPGWSEIQISEWVLTPKALARITEWEDVVAGGVK